MAPDLENTTAVSEAIARYRGVEGIGGPLFLGRDTHALSEPAFRTAGRGAGRAWEWMSQSMPTAGTRRRRRISHAILTHNARAATGRTGSWITPSHNPPEDGGFRPNPPHGGPADTEVTRWILEWRERAIAGAARAARSDSDIERGRRKRA